ncbi:hypothetical protein BDR04DRAFT_1116764 [Suillus decipiens]|nr:hypothetical protein BDR04DRAFT_1116764 [Suillus decipiens]
MQHPKSSDVSTDDWKEAQHDHCIKHCDQSENPELWEEIHEFWEGILKHTDKSPKAIYNCIMAIHNAFAMSCQASSCLEYIYVGGFVLYTGVFDGSPLILGLVNEKQADIKKLVDYLTTVIKYKCIDDAAFLPSFTHMMGLKFNPELSCEKGEEMHDHNHCGTMMLEKFVLTLAIAKYRLSTGLQVLVGPYLKCCMGFNYNAELTHVEHHELKKKKKDGSGALKVLEKEVKSFAL